MVGIHTDLLSPYLVKHTRKLPGIWDIKFTQKTKHSVSQVSLKRICPSLGCFQSLYTHESTKTKQTRLNNWLLETEITSCGMHTKNVDMYNIRI